MSLQPNQTFGNHTETYGPHHQKRLSCVFVRIGTDRHRHLRGLKSLAQYPLRMFESLFLTERQAKFLIYAQRLHRTTLFRDGVQFLRTLRI